QVLFALNQTLLQHEGVRAGSLQGSYTTEDLITHYNCGDLSSIIFNHDTSQLPHFINSSLPAHDRMTALQIDSYFRQELIYKRNERMARRVSALLQRNPNQTYFFAFGAGHFLGNHSVLDILRQEGYEIVHMAPDHQEPVTDSKPADSSEEATDTSPTSPPETEAELEDPENMPGLGDEELPHMLLPDSLSQLEEFGRHKRPRKAHRGHGRPRLFSDLWVRIGDSTTAPPNVRIINGYVTVEPPLTHQEQRRQMDNYATERHPSSAESTLPNLSSAPPALTNTQDTTASTPEQWNVPDKQGMTISQHTEKRDGVHDVLRQDSLAAGPPPTGRDQLQPAETPSLYKLVTSHMCGISSQP
ncbi:Metalloprotease TIKI2, partial [Nibea albiflora]